MLVRCAADLELDAKLLALESASEVQQSFLRHLTDRGIVFGRTLVPSFVRAHLVESHKLATWVEQVELFFEAIEHAVRVAVGDRAIASRLGFDDDAIQLFQIPHGYARAAVVARPDALECNGELRLVEINTDSPAMMTMADELQDVVTQLQPLASMRTQLSLKSRVSALLDAITACYREYGGNKSPPTIAIVDWRGEKTIPEQELTAARFTLLGTPTVTADPTELAWREGRLWKGERIIDVVYRRVLVQDFLRRRPELDTLRAAYEAGAICMVNPLRSALAGTKALLPLLTDASNLLGLAPSLFRSVRAIVAETRDVGGHENVDSRDWVLKKAVSHGGQDVVIGRHVTREQWRDALARAANNGWVMQAYVDVPHYPVPVLEGNRFVLADKYMNFNPFIFGGRHGGSITRVSNSPLVNINRGGGLLPTISTA